MKELVITLFYKIGATKIARMISARFRGDVQILMYHRVLPHSEYLQEGAGISTSTDLFEQHLKLLKEKYLVIPMAKILDKPFLKQCSKPPVIITFDDGYKDNFTEALPLLEKYQLPATFYIATDMLDEKIWMWWYELNEILESKDSIEFEWNDQKFYFSLKTAKEKKACYSQVRKLFIAAKADQHGLILQALGGSQPLTKQPQTLTWDDLRKMAINPLVTLGAHTVSHPILANISDDEVRQECMTSKLRLETETAIKIEHFAYPFGSHLEAGPREYNILRSLNFKTAVTTLAKPIDAKNMDSFAIPRLAVKKRTTAQQIDVKLSGWNYLWKGIQI